MYMGVILDEAAIASQTTGAPHVYGGDPGSKATIGASVACSPCIWG